MFSRYCTVLCDAVPVLRGRTEAPLRSAVLASLWGAWSLHGRETQGGRETVRKETGFRDIEMRREWAGIEKMKKRGFRYARIVR
jgi:hypothetical protein